MLGTLMKYEFKAVGRLLLPLYAAWIIAAVLLGTSLGGSSTSDNVTIMIPLTAVLYAVATVTAVVITTIVLIQRFYKNLLGNEGYLMFTLPVSTGKHLTNKIISAAAWTTIGVFVAILTGLAILLTIEGVDSFIDGMRFFIGDVQIMLEREPSSVLYVFEVLIMMFVTAAATAAEVYAAIAVGHQWSNHRVLGAIGAYIGFSVIETIAASLLSRLVSTGMFDGIMSSFYELSNTGQSHLAMVFAILAVSVMMAIYWFISWKLLNTRLNLE